MAKTAVMDYSTTAGSNTDIDGVDSTGATGLVKSGDNYSRSLMAHVKGYALDLGSVVTVGGTADAITVTLASAPSALADGMRFTFNASAANTGATTLNATPAGGAAFGAKKVMKWSSGAEAELSAGDIPAANALIEVIYDTARNGADGAWMMLGSSVAAATTSSAGIVELATTAETETGTDATRAVTPDGLHDMTTLAGAAWFLDEDDMTSNSATKVPSQQSVKAYVDANTLASGTAVSASGTAIDFTGLPSGLKEVVVVFSDLSTSGTSPLILQIGDSGGLEILSYTSAANLEGNATTAQTIGFACTPALAAANAHQGRIVIRLVDVATNTWECDARCMRSTTNFLSGMGTKSLSATLDRVRLTMANGTDTFDGGTVNIHYQ